MLGSTTEFWAVHTRMHCIKVKCAKKLFRNYFIMHMRQNCNSEDLFIWELWFTVYKEE